MNDLARNRSRKPLFIVIILLVLFAGPLLVAWLMVKDKDTVGEGTVNNGQLIQPPLQLANLPLLTAGGKAFDSKTLSGHWLMLYVNPGLCADDCEQRLYFMQQIRTATGKDIYRVERAIVTFTAIPNDPHLTQLLTRDYVGTLHLMVNRTQYQQFIQSFPWSTLAMRQGSLYLVDPLGNVMMLYAPDVKPAGIFKDLTRLLKASQIG